MCHISSRTRASNNLLSSIGHEVSRMMVTPDLEDVVPSRKRKRTLPRKPTKQTVKKEEEPDEDKTLPRVNHSSRPPTKKRIGRKSVGTIVKTETEEEVEKECDVKPPENWAETYSVMKEMRINGVSQNAAVDSMGCERIADANASPRERRFHTLISLMLSSQTKDTINAATMNRLYNELPPHQEGGKHGLTIDNILAVNANLLNQLIWAVGFHNNKTKYIKATAEILRDKWNSDIPDTFQGLVSLPGVGPKMAYLCLSSAWGRTEGIGVDVHVHRITNLWGWHKTKTPEESRVALQAWLPKELWHEINWLLVGLGQTTCLPVGRKCGECDLAKKGLCESANVKPKKKNTNVKNGMADIKFDEKQHQQQHTDLNYEFKMEANQDSPSNIIKIEEEDDL